MAVPTRLLIVDDSRIFRSALAEALAVEPDIQVIGSVWSGAKALEFMAVSPPDLVTLDVEMPGQDGLTTLRDIQQFNHSRPDQAPIGVIMVSAFTRAGAQVTLEALAAGAFDVVTKPTGATVQDNLHKLRQQLVDLVHQYMQHRRAPKANHLSPAVLQQPAASGIRRTLRAVLIAVSTGGPHALSIMLPDLCRRVEVPIFVVQHLGPPFTASLAELLDRKCAYRVIEASEGDVVKPRTVYIAPGGKHLLLRHAASGQIVTGLNEQPPENRCRPSADVLFRSAATVYGADAAAVVLTGMGTDGSAGLGPLKRTGAYIIVQDESTSVVWGMPGSALATGFVDEILPLERIPAALQALVAKKGER